MSTKLLSRHHLAVRWTDLDAYAHVNNSVYFTYMTEVRGQYFSEIMRHDDHHQFILVDVHCNYQKPIFYPSKLYIEQSLLKTGRASFDLSYTFYNHMEPDVILATAEAKMVCIDNDLGKAVAIPAVVLKLFSEEVKDYIS